MSTPTPRTDDEESRFDYSIIPHERHYAVNASFARQLERELEEAREEIGSLKAQAIELHMKACQLTTHKTALVKAREALESCTLVIRNEIRCRDLSGYGPGVWDDLLTGCVSCGGIESALTAINAALDGVSTPVQKLARNQPCGCVVCICEDDVQCQGCGAKNCGNPDCKVLTAPVMEESK